MKGDQIIRAVAACCLVLIYVAFVGLNGHRPLALGWFGTMDPFALTVLALLTLAFPELLDRLPFGPTRSKN